MMFKFYICGIRISNVRGYWSWVFWVLPLGCFWECIKFGPDKHTNTRTEDRVERIMLKCVLMIASDLRRLQILGWDSTICSVPVIRIYGIITFNFGTHVYNEKDKWSSTWSGVWFRSWEKRNTMNWSKIKIFLIIIQDFKIINFLQRVDSESTIVRIVGTST